MKRWKLAVECSERETRLLRLVGKSRKLFVFLREQRHRIFSDSLQAELESMYRDTGQGDEPQPPALMCMALLLQAYLQVSDVEAVRLSGTDRCWRMVLGTLADDDDAPAFSQGGLQQFRERLIRHDMDRRFLEHTVELAKKTRAFDWKKLPKNVSRSRTGSPPPGARHLIYGRSVSACRRYSRCGPLARREARWRGGHLGGRGAQDVEEVRAAELAAAMHQVHATDTTRRWGRTVQADPLPEVRKVHRSFSPRAPNPATTRA